MIDEKGKRHPSPEPPPVIPPHMLDGFNAAQRKAFGLDKKAAEEEEPAHASAKHAKKQ